MVEKLLAADLGALTRERVALNYVAPNDPDFAMNYLTARLDPGTTNGLPESPMVTLYAQPPADAKLDLARLATWLEKVPSKYPPAPDQLFVPRTRRGIVDGILAANERGDGERLRRFLCVRRTGTVEYGAYCAWSSTRFNQPVWLMSLNLVVLQFAQLLFFLDAVGSEFQLNGEWTLRCNARNVKEVVLVGFGKGWAQPFRDAAEVTFPLEDRFQLELSYAGEAAGHDAVLRDFASRFDFAFGSSHLRAYTYPG